MIGAELVQERLEQAGRTLLSMHIPSPVPREDVKVVWPEYAHSFADMVQWTLPERARVRPAVPSALDIDSMDEAFGWLSHIPHNRYRLRRVVGLRSLVVLRGDWMVHLHSWRAVGDMMQTSHETARTWHRQGLAWIVCALNEQRKAA